MKKRIVSFLLICVMVFCANFTAGVYAEGSNAKDPADKKTVNEISSEKYKDISTLKFGESSLSDVIKVFGEPVEYFWGDKKFTKDNLTDGYNALYKELCVRMNKGKLLCITVAEDVVSYGRVHIGTSIQDFVKLLGGPVKVEERDANQVKNGTEEDKVLYKCEDYRGTKGFGYYYDNEKGITISFENNKVDAIVIEQPYSKFIFRTLLSPKNELSIVRKPLIYYQLYQPDKLTSLPVYDPNFGFDLRSSDLTGLDLRDRFNELIHADFDNQTKWPDKLPEGFNPESIMELGKNPGLGLRNITQKGITGKNIGIAIIDASLLVDHVEYKDRLKLYEEIHCNDTQAQMHGPAVASIAAGKNVGVAPEADLYYIADTAGTINGQKFEYDLSWTAKSIDRIVQINKTLPKDKKIRVISISLGINPSMKNYDKAIESIKKAEKDGIYTVYVGSEAFFGLGRDPLKNPDDITSFSKGIFWNNDQYDNCRLLIPMDSRSTASPTGTNDYVFYRTGGMSWSVPYVAGLYALACQVKPDITPDVFWKEAFRTSDTIQVDNNGSKDLLGKIVNPQKLIGSIKNLK